MQYIMQQTEQIPNDHPQVGGGAKSTPISNHSSTPIVSGVHTSDALIMNIASKLEQQQLGRRNRIQQHCKITITSTQRWLWILK